MKHYIGVKLIKAEPMTRLEYNIYRGWELPDNENGSDLGYLVEYVDNVQTKNMDDRNGYVSWSPKEVFDAAYFPIKEESKISFEDVEAFTGKPSVSKLDEKTTIVSTETMTGFVTHSVSSCVDPKNYDKKLGTKIGMKRIHDKIWSHLGFVLQWGINGLKENN